MKATRWKTVEKVFNKSIILPPEERQAYVLSACSGDSDLIEDVLSLLAEAEKNDNFLAIRFLKSARRFSFRNVGLFDEPILRL